MVCVICLPIFSIYTEMAQVGEIPSRKTHLSYIPPAWLVIYWRHLANSRGCTFADGFIYGDRSVMKFGVRNDMSAVSASVIRRGHLISKTNDTTRLRMKMAGTTKTCSEVRQVDLKTPLKTRFMEPTWGPSGAERTQVGPMLALLTLLSWEAGYQLLPY